MEATDTPTAPATATVVVDMVEGAATAVAAVAMEVVVEATECLTSEPVYRSNNGVSAP